MTATRGQSEEEDGGTRGGNRKTSPFTPKLISFSRRFSSGQNPFSLRLPRSFDAKNTQNERVEGRRGRRDEEKRRGKGKDRNQKSLSIQKKTGRNQDV